MDTAAVSLAANLAVHDTFVFIWKQKKIFDAVRPVTAVHAVNS
jgi:hypothetical protein